jgi:SET domain-containing protein
MRRDVLSIGLMNPEPNIELYQADGLAGSGVFTRRAIPKKSLILELTGRRYALKDIPQTYPEDGAYAQTGPEEFMGPSGGLDDYFNHSCDPNCFVQKIDGHLWYVARKDIPANAELVWDYSTWMWKDYWDVPCHCGAKTCRGAIQTFEKLPPQVQQACIDEGAVPDFIALHYR